MSDNNFVFVMMGLRYTSRFLMMWRDSLRSSDLHVGLMEAVDEFGIVVSACACMISIIEGILESTWYVVSQSSVCVGKCWVR